MFLALVSLILLFSDVTISVSMPASDAQNCPRNRLAGDLPQYVCTDSSDWMGDGYNNEDCRAVIQRFFYVEVSKHDRQKFEFLKPGAKNTTDHPVMHTPRRYTVGESISVRTDPKILVLA